MTTPMTDENDADQQPTSVDLKKRLLIRVAIAGVMIVALLGGLAVLDSMNAPPPARRVAETPPPAIPELAPVPTPPSVPPIMEEKPAEQAAVEEAKKPAVAAAEPEASAPPTQSVTSHKEERPERPLTKPAVARLAMLQPREPLAAAQRAEPASELATARMGAPASRPLSRLSSQAGTFLLQLGVFNNIANAEELRAKLELNGIPAQIEARVKVGPFSSRREAEQAQDKLKKLGLDGGVMVAVKK